MNETFRTIRHGDSLTGLGIQLLIILFIFHSLLGCDEAGPTNPYDPVYSPEEPDYIANTYFVNADSTLTFTPELTVNPIGSSGQNELLMDILISIRVVNTSDSTYTIAPGRATVYTYDPRRRLTTVPLNPGSETVYEEPIPPDSDISLEYENPAIDEIPYQVFESEFYAAFTLFINEIEIIFVTQIFVL